MSDGAYPPPPRIGRRAALAGALALAAAPRRAAAASLQGVPSSGQLSFDVSRNGSKIGTHVLTFTRQANTLSVRFNVELRVGVGPITFYRYRHQGTELWRDGAFASIETQTDDNGNALSVRARRTPRGVVIQAGQAPEILAPIEARPLTHWAVAGVTTPLFNPQNGKLLHAEVQEAGTGQITMANGQTITARRISLAGEAPISDWYDESTVWVALDGLGKDGSAIRYRRA